MSHRENRVRDDVPRRQRFALPPADTCRYILTRPKIPFFQQLRGVTGVTEIHCARA